MARPPRAPKPPRRKRKILQKIVQRKTETFAEQQRKGFGRFIEVKAKDLVVKKKRKIKRIRKKALGYVTATAVSPRHLADLLGPTTFAEKRTEKHGLRSTAIVSFEYYPEQNMLILVWWKNWKKGIVGSAYAYFGVPMDTYEGLLKASSKGRYVYYNVRTSFKYKRL